MELQEATPSSHDTDTPTTSLASWFDYLSLEDFLGSGSFGFVFKAVGGAEALSAVKVIFMDSSGKSVEELEEDRRRISREYKLIQGKDHVNLLKILKSTDTPFTLEDFENIKNLNCLAENRDALDFIELQCIRAKRRPIPSFCIQMELCGKTLRQWLNAQSTENPEVYPVQGKIINGLATGLKCLHDNNIMHRDFRPENVMFTYSPTQEFVLPIKIGDFGLCRKVHSENTRTGTLTPGVGNDSYRAPETTGSNYGVQADLYSLGLVIWEVMQLIKYKDTRTMFYKLVHDSKTNLVKQNAQLHPNMREYIISLTKRRIQERAKTIPEALVLVEGRIMVESTEQLEWALLICGSGGTIEIKPGTYRGKFTLKTDNVTICFQKGSPVANHLELVVTGNGCVIKNFIFEFLTISGDDNLVEDSKCYRLMLYGNKNIISNCIIQSDIKPLQTLVKVIGNHNVIKNSDVFASFRSICIQVQGSGNQFLSIRFKNEGHVVLIMSGSNNSVVECTMTIPTYANRGAVLKNSWEDIPAELKIEQPYNGSGPFGLITTQDSTSCTITDSNFENAVVDGSQHKLAGVKIEKTLQLRGNGHCIRNCKSKYLLDASDNSLVIDSE